MKPYRRVISSPFKEIPHLSYGVIAFSSDHGRWFIVRRNYTPEFSIFLRGMYRHPDIPTLAANLTREECEQLLAAIGERRELERICAGPPEDQQYVWLRFQNDAELLKPAFSRRRDEREAEKPVWIWPKGRPSPRNEIPNICARREFREEAGLSLDGAKPLCAETLIERSRGSDGHVYETRYWIYVFERERDPLPVDTGTIHMEIRERTWVTTKSAEDLLTDPCRSILRLAISKIEWSRTLGRQPGLIQTELIDDKNFKSDLQTQDEYFLSNRIPDDSPNYRPEEASPDSTSESFRI